MRVAAAAAAVLCAASVSAQASCSATFDNNGLRASSDDGMANNGHPTHPENTLDGNANTIWDQVDNDPRPHILQVEGFGEQKLQGYYFDTWAINLHAPKSWTLRCMDNNQVTELQRVVNFNYVRTGRGTRAVFCLDEPVTCNTVQLWIDVYWGLSPCIRDIWFYHEVTIPPTTAAPTTAAPTTGLPTANPTPAPTTAIPTPAPTTAPSRHACDDGSHGCDSTDHGTCERMLGNPNNQAGYRCGCAVTHHCSDGDCATVGHTCVLNTESPTPAPSQVPTPTPTPAPTTSAPTTPAPTAVPSAGPTPLYRRNFRGDPIFPLDADGNEVLATNAWGQPVVPVDAWGNPVYPLTNVPSAAPSVQPSESPPSESAGSTGGAGAGGGGAVIVVVVVAVVLVLLVIGGAIFYVQSRKAGGGQPTGFANPAYDTAPSAGLVYAPPPAQPPHDEAHGGGGEIFGYMDVSAHDDAEDV